MTQTLQTWFSILFEGVFKQCDNLDKSLEMIEYSEIQTNETPFEGKSLGDKMLGAELEGGVAPLRWLPSTRFFSLMPSKGNPVFVVLPLAQMTKLKRLMMRVNLFLPLPTILIISQNFNIPKPKLQNWNRVSFQCLLVHEPYLDNGCIFPSMIIMILCFEKSWRCYVDVKKEVNLMTIM